MNRFEVGPGPIEQVHHGRVVVGHIAERPAQIGRRAGVLLDPLRLARKTGVDGGVDRPHPFVERPVISAPRLRHQPRGLAEHPSLDRQHRREHRARARQHPERQIDTMLGAGSFARVSRLRFDLADRGVQVLDGNTVCERLEPGIPQRHDANHPAARIKHRTARIARICGHSQLIETLTLIRRLAAHNAAAYRVLEHGLGVEIFRVADGKHVFALAVFVRRGDFERGQIGA